MRKAATEDKRMSRKYVGTGEEETDTFRLNHLVKEHGLTFKRICITYIFTYFNVNGLRQALGFAEGFDRAIASSPAQQLDEYALEIAYEVLAACDIEDCNQCHDAARKTITAYLSVLDQQKRRKIKRELLPARSGTLWRSDR
jgi:hypothetical protein